LFLIILDTADAGKVPSTCEGAAEPVNRLSFCSEVEDRVRHEAECAARLAVDIEDHDLVVAFLQPWRRKIERALRADVPEAAERLAVEEDFSFTQSARIEIGICRFVDVKCRPIEACS
jgi:hypothetical protein